MYIMTNHAFGVLYVGVTSDLPTRVAQHRAGTGSKFCRGYKLTRLVYAEQHESIAEAIHREKMIKAWKRAWKVELIEGVNPKWRDLWDDLVGA